MGTRLSNGLETNLDQIIITGVLDLSKQKCRMVWNPWNFVSLNAICHEGFPCIWQVS